MDLSADSGHDGRHCRPRRTIELTDTSSAGETRVITIPQPEGEVDPNTIFFTQTFLFVPEENGTHMFLVAYEDDEENPYEIYMDVAGPYWELENGCSFECIAGETYELCFQYPNSDGRYPTFTFYVGTEAADLVPKTGDADILSALCTLILSGGAAALLILNRKKLVQ